MSFTKDEIRKGMLLYAVTDQSWLKEGERLPSVCEAVLASGATFLQIREKDLDPGAFETEAARLKALCERYGVPFVVNDSVEIALAIDADGVHVGQGDMPLAEVRRLVGPEKIIGLSTHSPAQAEKAVRDGADYIGVGPIFATQTKEDVTDPVGFEYLEWVVENCPLPFVAIGGIKEHNVGELVKRGCTCCALVSELVGADDIAAKVAAVREAMKRV